jgi:predicted esterase
MGYRVAVLILVAVCCTLPAIAQQQPPPPLPYVLAPEERRALDAAERALRERLAVLPKGTDSADAAVFLHVAEMADRLRLYTNAGQVTTVLRGLETGLRRCDSLAKGARPWATRPGRTLRGFVSAIDGSVQPYGVVLPAGFNPESRTPVRLDVVLHGRGPTEVTFLSQMEPTGPNGAPAPEQPFMELHPFGRGNNGWRWAGESDVFEALAAVQKQFPVDPDRTILRGFSMGGHGAWHIGVHHPCRWAAVSPGAGFSDTRRYRTSKDPIPEYQERAWHIYDAVDYALNAFNTPFIGYGGEDDPQLQAALNMKEAMTKEGLDLNLIVGPKTGHAYHPESLQEIMRQLATHTRSTAPKQVRLTTWTLKYNHCRWVTIDALREHYRRATVSAESAPEQVTVRTENVTALTLDPLPLPAARLVVDGQPLDVSPTRAVHLVARGGGRWRVTSRHRPTGRGKQHGLQGPIDDAFTGKFLVVRGTGTPWNPSAQAYADETLRRFHEDWRFGFRGELPEKDDRDVRPEDYAGANLVLFGDPGSNPLLARIASRLPIAWTRTGLRVGDRTYGPDHVPVLIYPNPLNPQRYVVINSGHTFTRQDPLASNVYLYPHLPDWAVLKLTAAQPEVAAEGYFDEAWRLRSGRG